MIVIVSPPPRERAALGALCDSRDWLWKEYDLLRSFKRSLRTSRPRVVITRYRLPDGYSDEVLAALKTAGLHPKTKVIVLAPAVFPSALEARQISLGADLVQRDPVRVDVLVEYLQKFLDAAKRGRDESSGGGLKPFKFAGARVDPISRKLERGKAAAHLTPREVELAELLAESVEQVVSYETLFNDILGRRYQGDTSNLRVLLGKLAGSAAQAGIDLRQWVEVIPKLGYRYHARVRTLEE